MLCYSNIAKGFYINVLKCLSSTKRVSRRYHGIPFLDFYKKTTGRSIPKERLPVMKKKHPNIEKLSLEDLQWLLKVLEKFNINGLEACQNCHIFSMDPISVDNYGEILKECGFIKILPQHIIKYHTLVKSHTIKGLKKEGLIREDLNLEMFLQKCFPEWPENNRTLQNFSDLNTSILTVRMNVLEKYLTWKLSITSEDFQKYCRNYLPLKHKPMADIQEALNIAQNDIKLNTEEIRRNGFIISSDPIKTRLILDKVPILAGLDIKEAIRIEPGILKNNYNSILKIRQLLEEYRISEEAQRRYLRIYCMRPETVQRRLDELTNTKEYQILSTNPRVLWMVVHKKKMMSRLGKIETAKKQCYSLNHLVSSKKVFNNYINSFGDKVCGRDTAILICSSLNVVDENDSKISKAHAVKATLHELKRHKYYLHSSLHVIDETIQFLKKKFDDKALLNHCQLLMYPVSEIEQYLEIFLKMREQGCAGTHNRTLLDASYNSVNYAALTDDHVLSLVLYEIEKKHHFSGDGIWVRQDGVKLDSKVAN